MTCGSQPDFLNIVISRNDIEAGDISSTLSALAKLAGSVGNSRNGDSRRTASCRQHR
jgi:hypothetical protein